LKLVYDIICIEKQGRFRDMRAKDYKKRNSFSYKIKMWFYRLTFRDVMSISKIVIISVINFIMAVLGFLILFFGPSFF